MQMVRQVGGFISRNWTWILSAAVTAILTGATSSYMLGVDRTNVGRDITDHEHRLGRAEEALCDQEVRLRRVEETMARVDTNVQWMVDQLQE